MRKIMFFLYLILVNGSLIPLLFAASFVVVSAFDIEAEAETKTEEEIENSERYSYNFDNAAPYNGDNRILVNIKNYSKEEFCDFLLANIAPKEAKKYLEIILDASEQMQVDPFWMISIVWTESHFNPHAVSPVKAKGLMQIMPTTAQILYSKYHDSPKKTNLDRILVGPTINTKLGAVYLKELLTLFKGNHKLATVAYNMGPTRVIEMRRNGVPVGKRNNYLTKVNRSYYRMKEAYEAKLSNDFNLSI